MTTLYLQIDSLYELEAGSTGTDFGDLEIWTPKTGPLLTPDDAIVVRPAGHQAVARVEQLHGSEMEGRALAQSPGIVCSRLRGPCRSRGK